MSEASASVVSGSVVCGTNFTPAADRALAAALHLGTALGARVVLLHVVRREDERQQARQRLEEYARQHAPGVALALLVENGGDVPHAIARVARQQFAKVVTIGRHRHSQALLRMDVEDAINDLSPCPVLEVAAEDDPRAWPPGSSWPRQWPSATARCAAGRSTPWSAPSAGCASPVSCSPASSDIERGLHPEDKSLGVNPVPSDQRGR